MKMSIQDRINLYIVDYHESKAIASVKYFIDNPVDSLSSRLDSLEAIRRLNTELSDLYKVEIPVITCWVRDNSYVPETREIYLVEPELEGFLHQFRHHLQNVERRYERRGLCTEGIPNTPVNMPYTDCVYGMRGEDDAIAWSKAIIKLAQSTDKVS